MSKMSLFEKLASRKPSITRYHTTSIKSVPSIYESGLRVDKGGTGFSSSMIDDRDLDAGDFAQIFTTSRPPFGTNLPTYSPTNNSVTLKLKIPKEVYRNAKISKNNPEILFGYEEGMGGRGGLLETVQNGGRTDIFEEKIKPEYIEGVYDNKGNYYTIEDYMNFINTSK